MLVWAVRGVFGSDKFAFRMVNDSNAKAGQLEPRTAK